jgi:hypothetical protein
MTEQLPTPPPAAGAFTGRVMTTDAEKLSDSAVAWDVAVLYVDLTCRRRGVGCSRCPLGAAQHHTSREGGGCCTGSQSATKARESYYSWHLGNQCASPDVPLLFQPCVTDGTIHRASPWAACVRGDNPSRGHHARNAKAPTSAKTPEPARPNTDMPVTYLTCGGVGAAGWWVREGWRGLPYACARRWRRTLGAPAGLR